MGYLRDVNYFSQQVEESYWLAYRQIIFSFGETAFGLPGILAYPIVHVHKD